MAQLIELPTINRRVIYITPKKPFFEWINELDSEDPINEENFLERTAYAYSDDTYFMDRSSMETVMQKYYTEIFENELAGMWIDTKAWPKDRSWAEFNKWFDWEIAGLLFDLETGILEKEDEE
ncbi:hypothetical protein EMN47_13365 [Prolixibacteraceae bacterium JC049]|nr:hypothetical protein [Prolixibacteraceae bacterium JC049]